MERHSAWLAVRWGALGLLAVGTALLAGCGNTETDMRYKMTVEVETPEGARSGFAVREIVISDEDCWYCFLGEGRAQARLVGEAVAVDIAPGQTIYALLTGASGEVDYGARIAMRAEVWGKSPDAPRPAPVQLWPEVPKTAGLANTNPLPMLVRFGDPADPTSVEEVEPDALDKAFGPGVRLRRITVQATDEQVTMRIAERLGWLLDSAVMDNPGWAALPIESRRAINGMFSETVGGRK